MRNDKMLNVKWRYLCGWSAICILWNQNHRERSMKNKEIEQISKRYRME